jgi:hypothetical protein
MIEIASDSAVPVVLKHAGSLRHEHLETTSTSFLVLVGCGQGTYLLPVGLSAGIALDTCIPASSNVYIPGTTTTDETSSKVVLTTAATTLQSATYTQNVYNGLVCSGTFTSNPLPAYTRSCTEMSGGVYPGYYTVSISGIPSTTDGGGLLYT